MFTFIAVKKFVRPKISREPMGNSHTPQAMITSLKNQKIIESSKTIKSPKNIKKQIHSNVNLLIENRIAKI